MCLLSSAILFNQFGDCEGATLRRGNVHSAEGWQELLDPVLSRYQKKGRRLLFRSDAAFGKPEVYEYLEQEKIGDAIRFSANTVLQMSARPHVHLDSVPVRFGHVKPVLGIELDRDWSPEVLLDLGRLLVGVA